jgi:8-oxo-dGTP pyrophosphatase MutT (NUDIX family)
LKPTLALAPAPAKELARYLTAFPEEQDALAALSEQLAGNPPDIFERSNIRGHITTSALVLDYRKTHALLIDHIGLSAWLQPGGHYEGKGSLFASAMREVEEETGVSGASALRLIEGSSLLDIDTHTIPARPAKGEGEHVHHDFVYLAQAPVKAELSPQADEVRSAKWVALEDMATLGNPRLTRIAAKLVKLLPKPVPLKQEVPEVQDEDSLFDSSLSPPVGDDYPEEDLSQDESGGPDAPGAEPELTLEDLAAMSLFR